MNLNKHIDFFNPSELVGKEINIIGVGAVGSYIALQLSKLGIRNLTIWDFDTVEEHNITNQVYTQLDLGKRKVDALELHLKASNPNINIIKKGKYTNQKLSGIVFMEVDSVELRHDIAIINQLNDEIELLIDGRIGLETGQVHTVDWSNDEEVDQYIDKTDFKDDEVDVPRSGCGTTLSVSPSVLLTASYAVSNLINYCKGESVPRYIEFNAFSYKTAALGK